MHSKSVLQILTLAALAALSGCAGFTLGSFNYCAKESACKSEVRPFRPGEALPPGAAGAASAPSLPVVTPR